MVVPRPSKPVVRVRKHPEIPAGANLTLRGRINMLDIRLIREKPEEVRKNLAKRKDPEVLKRFDKLLKLDRKWRESLRKLEDLRHQQNLLLAEIAKAKKAGKPIQELVKKAKGLPEKIEELEKRTREYKQEVDYLLMRIPNLLHDSVPEGESDADNVEIRRWGKPPKFDFKPKNHVELAVGLGLMDLERARKVAGQGFVYLKNELVLLDLAIQRFAIDFLVKKGYTLIEPPFMIRRKPYEGVIDFEDFEMVTYKIEGEDWYMIATSEHPMAAMFMGEVLNREDLPIKLVGISPCFRKEVGTHGKYTKGLFRMHHFNKVEQFIFCHPDDSWDLHEELQENAEKLYQKLGIHYRVVNVCTGDIGAIAAKKYDIEAWMADGKFREVGSNSNCTDYQARRLGIRWREKPGMPPAGFVHTLNNTALATSRTMIAILEQYQQKDGSVKIPQALRPYLGFSKLEPKA